MSRTNRYRSELTRHFRNGPNLPGWWNLAVIGFAFVLFLGVAWSFINPNQPDAPLTGVTPGGGVTNPGVAPGGNDDSTTPIDDDGDDQDAPTPNVDENEVQRVTGVNGATFEVPKAAYDTALRASRALYDPQVAATVPLAGAKTFPAPTRKSPATFTALQLREMNDARSRATFVFAADPDGKGPRSPEYRVLTVSKSTTGWGFTSAT